MLPEEKSGHLDPTSPSLSTASLEISELAHGIDVLEESVRSLDRELLDILLYDQTTRTNILWGTTDYVSYGPEFGELCEITPELVTGEYATLIQPRITKSKSTRLYRTRDKAEVFTPSWICNKQNNLVDQQWFGRENVFNIENGNTWTATSKPISFAGCKKDWKEYVDAQRLEITCGEAPYLVSRYDTVTGEKISLDRRIGLLDRKMRIVRENTDTAEEWLIWSQRAFESVYGFEYQGDNLLLARENLLYSYIEYYYARFHQMPDIPLLRKIAYVISWNIWQMDGLKCVVPGSCKPLNNQQFSLFEDVSEDVSDQCPGCASGDMTQHTGAYCKIMDWRANETVKFVSLLRNGVQR